MTDTQTAADLSDTAAEAIRGLNHATHPGNGAPGLTYPGDAYTTVANLKDLAGRLPQSFEQLLAFLDQLNAQGALRSDRNDLDAELLQTSTALIDATAAALALRGALDRAHSALGAVGYVQPA